VLILAIVTVSGCIGGGAPRETCGNDECGAGENAYTCNADCAGVASCRIVQAPFPPNQGQVIAAAGGIENFAVEFINFNVGEYGAEVGSVSCGDGADLNASSNSTIAFGPNQVVSSCVNYTTEGDYKIRQVVLQDGSTNVSCTGSLDVRVLL